jgi:hypothetical protein
VRVLFILVLATCLNGQDGQQGSRPNWPCVAGRAVDPAYLELGESTGGQLFLFQKGEVGQAGPFMSASFTHPATIARTVGHLNGTRDLEFPVDSGVETLLLLVSVQCRKSILAFDPSGAELTDRNSALSVELGAGRILRVDQPAPGKWRVRLTGSGLFVLSVLAKAGIRLTEVEPLAEELKLRVTGDVSNLKVQLVDASSGRLADLDPPEKGEDGAYRIAMPARIGRYRVVVSGDDGGAWPFQRTHPVLYPERLSRLE